MLKYFCSQNLILCVLFVFVSNSFAQDVCRQDTCRYGECEQTPAGYLCHCFKGVKGRNCDQLLYPNESPCLSNPCWNGGICTSINSNSYCQCPAGYIGTDCKGVTTSPCFQGNPCKNNAICQLVAGNEQVCFCINEFTGKFCETKLPLCERQNPCYNGATCLNNKCVCAPNFVGEFCQTFKPQVLTNSLKIRNKGGYTAVATLTYRYSNQEYSVKKSILGGQSYTFSYQRQSSNVIITVGAIAYSKNIFQSIITQQDACFDVYGVLPSPKYTSISC